jgi:hypothetical protein
MWGQVNNPKMILKPHGWKIQDGKLEFDWDSDENIHRVPDQSSRPPQGL